MSPATMSRAMEMRSSFTNRRLLVNRSRFASTARFKIKSLGKLRTPASRMHVHRIVGAFAADCGIIKLRFNVHCITPSSARRAMQKGNKKSRDKRLN